MERVKEIISDFQVIKTKRRICSESVEWEAKSVNKGMGEEDKIKKEKTRIRSW